MAKKNKKTEGVGVLGFLRETAIILVAALILSTLLRVFVFQVFVIPSRSMENTLNIGDRVAVQKVAQFQRGDVVVFKDDLSWLPSYSQKQLNPVQQAFAFIGWLPDESEVFLIKRVMGVAGDHVQCDGAGGSVTVNGVALNESSYLYRDAAGRQVKSCEQSFDVVVPEGRIFVMGDHRNDSADSRCHLAQSTNGVQGAPAFVKAESVVGVAAMTVFPFDRGRIHERPDTFSGVPAGTKPPASPVIVGSIPRC